MTFVPMDIGATFCTMDEECFFCLKPIKSDGEDLKCVTFAPPAYDGWSLALHIDCFNSFAATVSFYWMKVLKGDATKHLIDREEIKH
jgi:hypothetical protein